MQNAFFFASCGFSSRISTHFSGGEPALDAVPCPPERPGEECRPPYSLTERAGCFLGSMSKESDLHIAAGCTEWGSACVCVWMRKDRMWDEQWNEDKHRHKHKGCQRHITNALANTQKLSASPWGVKVLFLSADGLHMGSRL